MSFLPEDWHKDPKVIGGVAAGAGGAAALKASKDFDRIINGDVRRWMESAQTLKNHGSITSGIEAAKNYAHAGHKAISGRVLGMPLPYWILQGKAGLGGLVQDGKPMRNVGDYLGGTVFRGLNKRRAGMLGEGAKPSNPLTRLLLTGRLDPNKMSQARQDSIHRRAAGILPNAGGHRHYKNYFKPGSQRALLDYALLDGVKGHIKPETLKALEAPDRSISRILLSLKKSNSPDYWAIRHHFKEILPTLYGGQGGVASGGLAQNYFHGAAAAGRPVIRGLRNAGRFGMAAAPIAVLAGMIKQREPVKQASTRENLIDAGLIGAGGAGGILGMEGLAEARRPFRVGVNYSDLLDVHGGGHQGPGKAIHEVLENLKSTDPRFKDMHLELPVRNRHGVVDPKFFGRKYHAMFDTGMGSTSPWDWGGRFSPNKNIGLDFLGKPTPPNVAYGGNVGYVTDLGEAGSPLGSHKASVQSPLRRVAQALGIKDKYITWGPKDLHMKHTPWDAKYMAGKFKDLHTGDFGLPTVRDGAMGAIQNAHRQGRQALIKGFLESGAATDDQARLLKNLGDKKLVFVTGSGRGDFVAQRVAELQKEVLKRGLKDKIQIAAAFGSGNEGNPLAQQLQKDKGLLSFKRLPQNFYVGLPGTAHMNWGSTGTSALMESLASPGSVAFLRDSEISKAKEFMPYLTDEAKVVVSRAMKSGDTKMLHDTLAGLSDTKDVKPQFAAKDDFRKWFTVTKNVDLETWNKGNKELAFRQPGVTRAQTASDLLDAMDKSDESVSAARGQKFMRGSQDARASMKEYIRQTLGQQQRWKSTMSRAKGAGGAGLLAGALALLGARLRTPEGEKKPLEGLLDGFGKTVSR